MYLIVCLGVVNFVSISRLSFYVFVFCFSIYLIFIAVLDVFYWFKNNPTYAHFICFTMFLGVCVYVRFSCFVFYCFCYVCLLLIWNKISNSNDNRNANFSSFSWLISLKFIKNERLSFSFYIFRLNQTVFCFLTFIIHKLTGCLAKCVDLFCL